MIYLVYLIILIIFAISEYTGLFNSKKLEGNIGYYLLFVLFVLLAGFRYRVGGDTLAYMEYFPKMPDLSGLSEIDYLASQYNPFWYLFNALVKLFWDDFVFFQLVHATIVNGAIFWFIKKYSSNKFLTVLFYFLFFYTYFNMEILRESLAASVFLFGYKFLLKKEWVKYYLICLICLMIHTSGIILFLLPFIYVTYKPKYLFLVIGLVLCVQFVNLFELFSFLTFFNQMALKMNSYLNREINFFGMLLVGLMVLPTLLMFIIRKNSGLKSHSLEKNVLPYLIIGLLAMVIGGFYRFLNYLALINIIFIVDSLVEVSRQRNHLHRLWMNLAVFSLFTYYTYYYCRDTSEYEMDTRFYIRYIPYHSVFDPEIEIKRENQYIKMMNLDW